MLIVLRHSWPLLLGIMLLMVGNGIQSTLLGIRGNIEGFTTFQLSVVMSAYFLGFLFGSRLAPRMIRRVGHVRVFSALGSMISAILVVYPVLPDWVVWAGLRVLIGFAFSGIYITSESWLNNTATNETRGQALSAYMIVQMIGIVSAQVLLNVADPADFTLFVIPSVLVSLAFMPILLAATPSPTFELTQGLSFRELFRISPLGCIGMLLTGGIFSALFGMASVYGGAVGLSVPQISTFIAAMYLGGLVLLFPLGLLSDRMDRRRLILYVLAFGLAGTLIGIAGGSFGFLVAAALIVGGAANSLYGMFIAYANDHLEPEDMSSASGRLIFLNGVGATAGPLITGGLMAVGGPKGFWLFLVVLYAGLLAYGIYRSFRRAAPDHAETGSFVPVLPVSTEVALAAAREVYMDSEEASDPGASSRTAGAA